MAVIPTSKLVDAAIAEAKTLPALHEKLQAVDPALAAQLESKPLAYSRTPPAIVLAFGLAWLSSRYGLNLDANLDALIAGAVVLVVSYAMRWITSKPIAGLIRSPAAAAADVAAH